MKAFFLFILLTWAANSFGAQKYYKINELETDLISRALSPSDFEEKLALLKEIRILESACALQSAENIVPTHCYHLLRLSKPLQLAVIKSEDELNIRCVIAAKETQATEPLVPGLVPENCFKIANEKIKINRYKSGMNID